MLHRLFFLLLICLGTACVSLDYPITSAEQSFVDERLNGKWILIEKGDSIIEVTSHQHIWTIDQRIAFCQISTPDKFFQKSPYILHHSVLGQDTFLNVRSLELDKFFFMRKNSIYHDSAHLQLIDLDSFPTRFYHNGITYDEETYEVDSSQLDTRTLEEKSNDLYNFLKDTLPLNEPKYLNEPITLYRYQVFDWDEVNFKHKIESIDSVRVLHRRSSEYEQKTFKYIGTMDTLAKSKLLELIHTAKWCDHERSKGIYKVPFIALVRFENGTIKRLKIDSVGGGIRDLETGYFYLTDDWRRY